MPKFHELSLLRYYESYIFLLWVEVRFSSSRDIFLGDLFLTGILPGWYLFLKEFSREFFQRILLQDFVKYIKTCEVNLMKI